MRFGGVRAEVMGRRCILKFDFGKMKQDLGKKFPGGTLQGRFFTPQHNRAGRQNSEQGGNIAKSCFICPRRRKKLPNSNPAGGSVPMPLNSRNFPLFPGFPVSSLIFQTSPIGRQNRGAKFPPKRAGKKHGHNMRAVRMPSPRPMGANCAAKRRQLKTAIIRNARIRRLTRG